MLRAPCPLTSSSTQIILADRPCSKRRRVTRLELDVSSIMSILPWYVLVVTPLPFFFDSSFSIFGRQHTHRERERGIPGDLWVKR
ncbi:hypothetical protein IE53DRAFT_89187 [Violaceomyces palustris]|uniref:Uncharacterized protein n=1 Tax=Violaceomyces palustris TaxID=1673888 RepID=A0ACD0NXI8_9BASI|nr:hypothetical protein IE53DRAFT_89187 [Violaceomyces palustris]